MVSDGVVWIFIGSTNVSLDGFLTDQYGLTGELVWIDSLPGCPYSMDFWRMNDGLVRTRREVAFGRISGEMAFGWTFNKLGFRMFLFGWIVEGGCLCDVVKVIAESNRV